MFASVFATLLCTRYSGDHFENLQILLRISLVVFAITGSLLTIVFVEFPYPGSFLYRC
jgi:hypothetical protein